jgi:hypothetical protein
MLEEEDDVTHEQGAVCKGRRDKKHAQEDVEQFADAKERARAGRSRHERSARAERTTWGVRVCRSM